MNANYIMIALKIGDLIKNNVTEEEININAKAVFNIDILMLDISECITSSTAKLFSNCILSFTLQDISFEIKRQKVMKFIEILSKGHYEHEINTILIDANIIVREKFEQIGTQIKPKDNIETITEDIENQEINIENVIGLSNCYKKSINTSRDSKNTHVVINSYHEWYNLSITLFSRFFDDSNNDYKKFKDIDNSGNGYVLNSNFNKIQGHFSVLCDKIKREKKNQKNKTIMNNKKIFIVHGHDDGLTSEVARFIKDLDFEPIILREQASGGNTIIEKIAEYSNVGFGIVLYTPCDLGAAKGVATEIDKLSPRARQNVVFEHGYLIGKIGRKNVCAVKCDGVETPGDISGVVYISKDAGGSWRNQIANEMKNAGLEVDKNKIK